MIFAFYYRKLFYYSKKKANKREKYIPIRILFVLDKIADIVNKVEFNI